MEHSQRLLAAQYRLAQHYLDTLRTAQRVYRQGSESEEHALTIFDRERDQVKQWQAWAAKYAGQDDRAATLCSDYARACPDIFNLRLLPHEYCAWLDAALAAARLLGDQRAEATHLLSLCEKKELMNERSDVTAHAQHALAIARQAGDQSLVAHGLEVCGDAVRNQGNLEEAQAYYEQSLALYRTINDRRGMATLLVRLGMLAIASRKNAAAQDYLEQSLALYQEIGHQEGLNTCLNNLGFLAIRRGNYEIARNYLEQSLALCRMMGDKQGICIVLTNLGTISYYEGDFSLARNYLEESLSAARAAHVREREAICLYKFGLVTMAQGDMPMARDSFEQSLAFSRSTQIGTLLPETLGNLALAYQLLRQEDHASAVLREGLEIVSQLPAPMEHAKLLACVAAARMWILKGKPLQAAAWLGLVENHSHPAVKMTDIKRDVQVARTECARALSPEQIAAAWEEGKNLDVDTVVAHILSELEENDQVQRPLG